MAERANGNANPASDLLRQKARVALARQNMAEPQGSPIDNASTSKIIQDIMAFQAAGLKAAPLSESEIVIETEDGPEANARLGTSPSRDLIDQVNARRHHDIGDSIALDLEATRGDKRIASAVAAELRKGPLAGVAQEYIEEQLERIVAKAPSLITYATAGKILERSKAQRAPKGVFSFAHGAENWSKLANIIGIGGSPERDIGGGNVIKEDRVMRYIEEVASGQADQKISEAKRREAASAQIQTAQAMLDRANAELAHVTALARGGNRHMAALVPDMQRKVESMKAQLSGVIKLGEKDTMGPPIDPKKLKFQ